MKVGLNKPWIEKMNNISARFIMPTLAVMFILTNTIINLWLNERIETFENVLAILVLFIVASNMLANPKVMIPQWCRENIMVILYFIARAISLWQSGFDYTVLRTVFFEAFYLIGITNCTVGTAANRDFYIKTFVWIELAFTIGSLILYYASTIAGSDIQDFLMKTTYLEETGKAMLFSNQNTAGIMSGFAVIIAMACYGKKIFNKKFTIFYGIYNVAALLVFGCRSAEMGLLAAAAIWMLTKIVPGLKGRRIAAIVLILMTSTLIPLYAFMESQSKVNDFDLSDVELTINTISSERYLIWKSCYHAQKDDLLFGIGSLKLEKEDRTELVADVHYGYYWKFWHAATFGPHNGYIGMISCAGFIGLILFVTILLQRIWRSGSMKKGNWYLILIFIFVINAFESLFILNKFYTCFYMLLLLTIDFEEEVKQEIITAPEVEK